MDNFTIRCLTVSLCPNFIFYYWYLFKFIENGLNVKDKRRFGEQKKTNIISHESLKQDIRCTCTERDETKAFKRVSLHYEFVSAKFHISIIKAPLLVGALPPLFALLLTNVTFCLGVVEEILRYILALN